MHIGEKPDPRRASEREKEGPDTKRERERERECVYVCVCVYAKRKDLILRERMYGNNERRYPDYLNAHPRVEAAPCLIANGLFTYRSG